jgi:hypothetical protein
MYTYRQLCSFPKQIHFVVDMSVLSVSKIGDSGGFLRYDITENGILEASIASDEVMMTTIGSNPQ